MKEKVLDERCENCGARLKQHPDTKGGSAIVSCPNDWRKSEKFDECQEVVREISPEV